MLEYSKSNDKDNALSNNSMVAGNINSSDVRTRLITQTSDSSTGIQFTYKKVERLSSSAKSLNTSSSRLDRSGSHSDSCETNSSFSDKFTMSCPDYYKSVDPNSILPNSTFVRTDSDAGCNTNFVSEATKAYADNSDCRPPKSKAMKHGAVKVKKNLEKFYSDGEKACKICNASFDSLQTWCKHTIVIHPAYAKELSIQSSGSHLCKKCQRSFKTFEGLHYHLGLSIC